MAPPSPPQPSPAARPQVHVVVLTGGASRRMGRHKPALEVGGQPMLARVLAAVGDRPALVVGDPEGAPSGIRHRLEERPGEGPVAALASTLAYAAELAPRPPDVVVVLAGDLPFLTSAHIDRLVRALATEGTDLAVTLDADGRDNWLCAAWRTTSLRAALERLGDPAGQSMRALVADLAVVTVADPDGVATDVDTPEDLAAARRRASRVDDRFAGTDNS